MARGRQGAVLDWLARLPAAELDRRPRLLLAAAWTLALSERHDEAEPAGRAHPRAARRRRRAALRMRADPRAARRCSPTTRTASPRCTIRGPMTRRCAIRCCCRCMPTARRSARCSKASRRWRACASSRRRAATSARRSATSAAGANSSSASSYLWEGQVLLAEKLLRPTLARAEGDLGRRKPFACMLAALLAAALWERDRPDEAAALLANRLDVLERSGLPETVLLGFRTWRASRRRRRRAPRARTARRARRGRRRAHACRACASPAWPTRCACTRVASAPKPAATLCERIDALLADDGAAARAAVAPQRRRCCATSRRGTPRSRRRSGARALDPLTRADALARELKQGRLHIELLGLRALALDRCGEKSLGRCCARRSTWRAPTACCASSPTRIRRSATGCARRSAAMPTARIGPAAGGADAQPAAARATPRSRARRRAWR